MRSQNPRQVKATSVYYNTNTSICHFTVHLEGVISTPQMDLSVRHYCPWNHVKSQRASSTFIRRKRVENILQASQHVTKHSIKCNQLSTPDLGFCWPLGSTIFAAISVLCRVRGEDSIFRNVIKWVIYLYYDLFLLVYIFLISHVLQIVVDSYLSYPSELCAQGQKYLYKYRYVHSQVNVNTKQNYDITEVNWRPNSKVR